MNSTVIVAALSLLSSSFASHYIDEPSNLQGHPIYFSLVETHNVPKTVAKHPPIQPPRRSAFAPYQPRPASNVQTLSPPQYNVPFDPFNVEIQQREQFPVQPNHYAMDTNNEQTFGSGPFSAFQRLSLPSNKPEQQPLVTSEPKKSNLEKLLNKKPSLESTATDIVEPEECTISSSNSIQPITDNPITKSSSLYTGDDGNGKLVTSNKRPKRMARKQRTNNSEKKLVIVGLPHELTNLYAPNQNQLLAFSLSK